MRSRAVVEALTTRCFWKSKYFTHVISALSVKIDKTGTVTASCRFCHRIPVKGAVRALVGSADLADAQYVERGGVERPNLCISPIIVFFTLV